MAVEFENESFDFTATADSRIALRDKVIEMAHEYWGPTRDIMVSMDVESEEYLAMDGSVKRHNYIATVRTSRKGRL